MSRVQQPMPFFSTSPTEVIGDLVNHINDYAADALEDMERHLCAEGVANPKAIKEGLDQFQLRFQRTVDAKMDKLEEYAMRNIFHVPEDLCVLDAPEDADAALGSPQPVSVLDEELQELADNIAQAVAVRRALVGELKQAQLQMAAHVQYAPALAPIAPLVPEAGLDDNSVRLRTALHTLERNANALDQIREKVVERLARGAPDGGRDAELVSAPAIKTGDLEDLAKLSRTLRELR